MSRSPIRIGIIVNQKKASAPLLLSKITRWLGDRGIAVANTAEMPVAKVIEKAGLLVCLGGDGTILYAASHLRDFRVPILGVNLGSLGFLTEVREEEVLDELETYLAGKSIIEERSMLSCKASSAKHKKKKSFNALNDIVISREGLSRLVSIEVAVNHEKLTHFSGDGVIVATPTGSTAYSLSAGGSVVHPSLEALIITPICPHASSLRSMVVSAREKIVISLKRKGSEPSKALLTADGQENLVIDDSYSIEITRSEAPLRMIKSSKRSYFVTLRENFKFPV